MTCTPGLSTSGRRAVAVLLPSLILLAGCGSSEAGAAAVVGSRRIEVSQVQTAYRDILPVVGPDAQLSQSDVLNWLILKPYLLQAAAQNNIGISAEDARDQFRTGDTDPHPSAAALDAVEAALAINRLQGGELPSDKVQQVFEGVVDEVKRDSVQINPRYGTGYDASKLLISTKTEDWLVPGPGASATPAPSGTVTPEPTETPTP